MKKIILSTILLAMATVLAISCKKERTCVCSTATTEKTTEKQRNSSASTSTTVTKTSTSEDKYAKVKKDDMHRLLNCNSRTESYTESSSYPSTVFTGSSIATVTIDVTKAITDEMSCEVK